MATRGFFLKAVLALALVLPSTQGIAEEAKPFLLDYQHKSLRDGRTTDLSSHQGKPVAMMFFEPECGWCMRQVKVLKQMLETCEHSFTPVALGVHGDRLRLKRTLFKLKFPHPAFQASYQLVQQLGGIPATPILLIADKQGYYAKYFRGLTDAETLQPYLCPA